MATDKSSSQHSGKVTCNKNILIGVFRYGSSTPQIIEVNNKYYKVIGEGECVEVPFLFGYKKID